MKPIEQSTSVLGQELIFNRVASSSLISLDPEKFRPNTPFLEYDLRQNLYLDQILREKEFREFLAKHDWSKYQGASVALHCSIDAIVPLWAYMLVAGCLESVAKQVIKGNLQDLECFLWDQEIQKIDLQNFVGKKVVVKGCGSKPIPDAVYISLTWKLKPIVKSLLFGEPCSTVPLFKN